MSDKQFDESKKKGLSIASLVLGIIGLLISLTPIGIIASILAIVFGGISLKKMQGVKGCAIAGLVLGIISLVLCLIFILAGIGLTTLFMWAQSV